MAAKPSTSSSVPGATLAANASAKSGATSSASAGSSQFDEAFASALQQDKVGVNRSATPLPASPKQSAQGVTSSIGDPASNRPAPDPKVLASTPNVQASIPVDVTAQPLSKDVRAAARSLVPDSPPALKEQRSSSLPSSEGESRKPKKADTTASQSDVQLAATNDSVAIATAPITVSVPAPSVTDSGQKNSPPQNTENALQAQQALTPTRPMQAAAQPATPSAAAVPGPTSVEAFSINLTPKTPSGQNSAPSLPVKPTSKSESNKPATTGQSALPNKSSANPAPPVEAVQEDPLGQDVQPKKTVSLQATNDRPQAPSSLGQGQTSTVNRDGKSQDKEEASAPANGVSEAAESKQGFPGLDSVPASYPKETKDAAGVADARPVAQPLPLQETAPAGGAAKQVAIQLQSQSGETINVKVADQGGQVQVTVRSSDPAAASALRQDLTSLTGSLDKAGWKPEIAAVAGGTSLEPANQTRSTDRNQQDPQGSKQPEWQQETPKKRPSVSDLWDQLLTNQTT